MNKHLNNWLDKIEGKKIGSTNKNIAKELERQGYGKSLYQAIKEKDHKTIYELETAAKNGEIIRIM